MAYQRPASQKKSSSSTLIEAKQVSPRPRKKQLAASDVGRSECFTHFEALQAIAHALKAVVSGNTEIVIHDLTRPEASIVEIINGDVSNRRVGQSLLSAPMNDHAFGDIVQGSFTPNEIKVVSGYTTLASNGRTLQASSVIFCDQVGRPQSAFCVNVDPEALFNLQRQLTALFPTVGAHDAPSKPNAPHMDDEVKIDVLVENIICEAIESAGVPISRMHKQEKLAAVNKMHQRGLFLIRGSVELVSKRLQTTKFTIYNYLDQLGVKTR